MSHEFQMNEKVRVLRAGGSSLRFADAWVDRVDEAAVELLLDEVMQLRTGAHVIVEVPSEAEPVRVICSVVLQAGRRLRLLPLEGLPSERRAWPRVEAALHFRYRPADLDELGPWLAGETLPGHLHEPVLVSDFSVTGVAFDDVLPLHVDETLLVELAIPDRGEAWRGTVRVVRCLPLPDRGGPAHRTAGHRVACTFTHIPEGAVWALAQYTLQFQRMLEVVVTSTGPFASRHLGGLQF